MQRDVLDIKDRLKLVDQLKVRFIKNEQYMNDSFKLADEKINFLDKDLARKTHERQESQKKFEIYINEKFNSCMKE
jgi:hypothetical protein